MLALSEAAVAEHAALATALAASEPSAAKLNALVASLSPPSSPPQLSSPPTRRPRLPATVS